VHVADRSGVGQNQVGRPELRVEGDASSLELGREPAVDDENAFIIEKGSDWR
jgi:hypothetical protein